MRQHSRRLPSTAPSASASAPLPSHLYFAVELREAGTHRDIGAIFRFARAHGHVSVSKLAQLCEMTPSRVSAYAQGRTRVRDLRVIERVADGLRIPGVILGLAPRPWEITATTEAPPHALAAGGARPDPAPQ